MTTQDNVQMDTKITAKNWRECRKFCIKAQKKHKKVLCPPHYTADGIVVVKKARRHP